MWRPGDGLNCRKVAAKLACWLELVVHRPHEELVVVTSRCELLLVVGPLEPADFLLVTLQRREVVVRLPEIALQNRLVLRTRAENVLAPANGADSALVALEHSEQLGLVDVPNLHDTTVRADGEVLPSFGPAH